MANQNLTTFEVDFVNLTTAVSVEDGEDNFEVSSVGLSENYDKISTAEHVVAVTCIAFACFLGNATVIYIYLKKEGNSFGKLYYILLAAVDIIVCCTLLPAFPFIRLRRYQRYGNYLFSFMGVISMTYAWILLTMTLERMLAIFRPFSIVTNRRKLHKIALGLYSFHMGSVVIATTLNLIGGAIYGYFVMLEHFLFLFIALTVIVVSYPSMIYKLVFEARAMAKYQVDDHVMQNRTQSLKKKQQQPSQSAAIESSFSTQSQTFDSVTTENVSTIKLPNTCITAMQGTKMAHKNVRTPDTQQRQPQLQQQQQANISSRNRARNLTTVKVFSAVLILYLASFLPPILVAFDVVSNFYTSYTYFVNHVGNPICYYVINVEFRDDVHKLFIKLKRRLRK